MVLVLEGRDHTIFMVVSSIQHYACLSQIYNVGWEELSSLIFIYDENVVSNEAKTVQNVIKRMEEYRKHKNALEYI